MLWHSWLLKEMASQSLSQTFSVGTFEGRDKMVGNKIPLEMNDVYILSSLVSVNSVYIIA